MLADGEWLLASTAPNEVADPWQLDGLALAWTPATVPGTVGQENADGRDWWYRCAFADDSRQLAVGSRQEQVTSASRTLCFEGLATLAQVWLNGELILESDNMFRQYRVEVSLRAENELVLCFRSLDAALAQRRPRPRWKTRLVKHQQLRWFRTTLLGRIPGWTPPVPIIGPWRPIHLGVLWRAPPTNIC
jgi:beta-mannosidase